MGNSYQDYALLSSDDPLEQCILYFWDSLEDEIYPKHFLDSLLQMVEDIESGRVETIPFTKDMLDRMDDLVGDVTEEKDD